MTGTDSSILIDTDSILENRKLQLSLKRIFDILCSLIGLLILLPALLAICVLVKTDTKGPVFFRQVRVGQYGRVFRILKFRTMADCGETMAADDENPEMQLTVGNDPRITRTGYFLRRTKLDELPQLLNVLAGDMSLVGPRPEVPKYVALYDENQRNILKVKPGITDIASVYFRNESDMLSKEKEPEKAYIEKIMPYKIYLNSRYLSGISVLNDIRIIFLTVFIIISGKEAGEIQL